MGGSFPGKFPYEMNAEVIDDEFWNNSNELKVFNIIIIIVIIIYPEIIFHWNANYFIEQIIKNKLTQIEKVCYGDDASARK